MFMLFWNHNINNQRGLQIIQYQINQEMMPSGIVLNLFSPSYVQSPLPIVHVCYIPSNTYYAMQQGYTYSNLDETSLLKYQFQSQNAPPIHFSSAFPSQIDENQPISINEGVRVNESILIEQGNMTKEKQKQKFGRNIKSNIFGNMLLFVRKKKSMKVLTRKIIQKHRLRIKITEFYYILNKKSKYRKAYFTKNDIAAFLEGEEVQLNENAAQRKENQFKIVFRILYKLYLNKYHIPYIFSSNKIKKQSKRMHLELIREYLRF